MIESTWPPYFVRTADLLEMDPAVLHAAIRATEKKSDLPRGEIARELRRLDAERTGKGD